MPLLDGFIGPSAVARSTTYDNEESINLYLEALTHGTAKTKWALYGMPGTVGRYKLPEAPIRCLFPNGDGRAFAVAGSSFVELKSNGTYLVRGSVAVDANPATIASNGTATSGGSQLAIASGGNLYGFALDTNTFTQVTEASIVDLEVAEVAYLSAFFLVRIKNSNLFFYSQPLDVFDIPALNFFRTTNTPDNKPRMIVSHDDLWLLGSLKSEVWQATGNANTTFAPNFGSSINYGTGAPWSAATTDNTFFTIVGNDSGSRMVMRADGYSFKKVSTNPVDTYMNRLPTVSDGIGFTYQIEGHEFYLLYLPAADKTLCYDVSVDEWTFAAIWNVTLMRWEPFRGRNHMLAFERHLIGDRSGPGIYELRMDVFHDEVIL